MVAPRSIVVVSAGLSQPSATRLLADRIAAATHRALRDADVEAQLEVVELREHAQDLVNHLLTGFPGPHLRSTIDLVLGADAVIAVTPIFSASYSGLFKLFFDVLERDGLASKPVLIGATGGSTRHSLALDHAVRPLFAYLNAAVMPTAVYAATEDWGQAGSDLDGALVDRIDHAARELAIVVAGRPAMGPTALPTQHVAFETLLAAGRDVP